MSSKSRNKRKKFVVPGNLLDRMRTEHGGHFGFRTVVIGNFYSYEPNLIVAQEHGLLEDDLNVLANLRDWGGMTANVISTLTGRPKNNISRAVKKLTEGGFVDTQIDSDDRRRVILTITASGNELFETAIQPFRAQEERMFGCLSKQEASQLDKLFLKILRNWSDELFEE